MSAASAAGDVTRAYGPQLRIQLRRAQSWQTSICSTSRPSASSRSCWEGCHTRARTNGATLGANSISTGAGGPVFTPKQDIGADVFANSLGVNTGPPERVELEFAADVAPYVRARVWHASQDVREHGGDGRVRLTMDVCHDWALRSWILSWGPFARVVSPAPLAAAIREDLEAAGSHYKSP